MTALRLCFVGDSLTLGTGDDGYLGWPGRAVRRERAAGHDVTLYNLGIRAETTADIARRWRTECEPRLPAPHPGALVFSFGANDMAELDGDVRVPVQTSVETARTMISEASVWKTVLWVGPTPVIDDDQPFHSASGVDYTFSSQRIAELSDCYADVAGDLGVPYLDLFTPLSATSDWPESFVDGDGVHPRDPGYALIAERFTGWSAWRALFDQPDTPL
jgi:acyl-CoA thioesterase I